MCQKLVYSFCVVFAFSLLLFLGVRLSGGRDSDETEKAIFKIRRLPFSCFYKKRYFSVIILSRVMLAQNI